MWNKEQEQQLKELLNKRPYNWASISEKMGKSVSACQSKASRLGLTSRLYSGKGTEQVFKRWYGKMPNSVFRAKFFPKWSLPQVKLKAFRLRKKGIDLPRYKKKQS